MSKDTIINWIAFGSGAIAIQAMLYRLYSRANYKQITKEKELRNAQKELRNARFEQAKKEYEEKQSQLLKRSTALLNKLNRDNNKTILLKINAYMEEQNKMISDNPARFNR